MTSLTVPCDRREIVSLCIYYNVPIHMAEGIRRYFCDHGRPGDFLYAVLTNDLKEACGRADDTNKHHLHDFIRLFYSEAPAIAWGSVEKVEAWLAEEPADAISQG